MTPELLSPAGNMQKLKSALLYGADAVYCAGKLFGMRASADNFELSELFEAIEYAHERKKKLYLTVNTSPGWREYEALTAFLRSLSPCPPDALIVADPGVFTLAKKLLPKTDLHVSTQAGAVSADDCAFWYEQGAVRVVLSRELTFEDIYEIKKRIPRDLELETFVHGSMCVSFSGRCLLSQYMTGRSADKGCCTQPCRWNYKLYELEEEQRPGERFPIVENELGTFIMSSKDLNMIGHIPELMRAGISSFKIEGRMKSAYYAAVTANTYRMAMDEYARDPEGFRTREEWEKELRSVSHRAYCTGYFFDDPRKAPQTVSEPGYIREKAYLAVAKGYDENTGRAFFVQRNKAYNGQKAELLTPGKCGRDVILSDMRDLSGEPIDSAPHPFMEYSIRTDIRVKEGDILRGTNTSEGE